MPRMSMSYRASARLVAFLVLFCLALVGAARAQDQILRGVAVGPENALVGGLLLELRTGAGGTFYAVTGEDGRFAVEVPREAVSATMDLVWDPTGPREGVAEVTAAGLAQGAQVLLRVDPVPADASPPKLRFSYHTAAGYDASILLTGFAPPRLRDSALYADKTMVILATRPFEFGAAILQRYGSRYVDSSLEAQSSVPEGPEAVEANAQRDYDWENVAPDSYLVSAYGDERMVRERYRTLWTGDPRMLTVPIPEVDAVKALVADNRLPQGFRYRLRSLWRDAEGISMPPPSMVRPLTFDDILRHGARTAAWSDLPGGAQTPLDESGSAFGTVDLLEPLLAFFPDGDLPPSVAEVRLNWQPAGCTSFGFWFETVVPELSVEVLVIENVSGGNVALDEFTGRLDGGDAPGALRAALYPQRILTPDEVLVVPVALMLAEGSTRDERYESWADRDAVEMGLAPMGADDRAALAALPPDRLVPVYVPTESWGDEPARILPQRRQGVDEVDGTVFSCRAQSIVETWDRQRAQRPISLAPVAAGPRLTVDAVDVDGVTVPVRVASRTASSVIGGLEGGSCPFLLVQDPRTGVWVNTGPVIVGAVGPEAAMTETVLLPPGATRVRILEHEMETSYLTEVAFVPADAAQAGKVAATPAAMASIRLDHGEWVEFEADAATLAAAGGRLALRISGYYEPW